MIDRIVAIILFQEELIGIRVAQTSHWRKTCSLRSSEESLLYGT